LGDIRVCAVHKECYLFCSWDCFQNKRESLRVHFRTHVRKTCSVPTWMSQTLSGPQRNRIANSREYDRYDPGGLQRSFYGGRTTDGKNHVDLQFDELRREAGKSLIV